jgi:hypothetical protein
MRIGRLLFFLMALLLAWPWFPTTAEAGQNCGVPPRTALANPINVGANYDPTAPVNANIPVTMTFQAPPGLGPCVLWITLTRGPSGSMSGPGGAHLSYDFSGALHTAYYDVLNLNQDANGNVPDASGGIVIGAHQNVPAGTYSDTLTINVNSAGATLSKSTLTVSATVSSSCALPAPTLSSLDFTPGILNGRATSYRQTTTIQGASCTGPATLTLRGTPLTTSTSVAAFTNSINYNATATFGPATASLSTASAAQASTSVPAVTGAVTIGVALADGGKPLAAGSYSSILSIVLEPSN